MAHHVLAHFITETTISSPRIVGTIPKTVVRHLERPFLDLKVADRRFRQTIREILACFRFHNAWHAKASKHFANPLPELRSGNLQVKKGPFKMTHDCSWYRSDYPWAAFPGKPEDVADYDWASLCLGSLVAMACLLSRAMASASLATDY